SELLCLLPDDCKFEGTIFRFPIRSQHASMKSRFKSQSEGFTWSRLRDELNQTYCDQARKSLVMLTRVQKIGFYIRSSRGISSLLVGKCIWSVSSTRSPVEQYSADDDV